MVGIVKPFNKIELQIFHLAIVVIEAASESEIRQLFRRLQEGVTLNPAEKRNAIAW